jgi:alpha-L-fucosidase
MKLSLALLFLASLLSLATVPAPTSAQVPPAATTAPAYPPPQDKSPYPVIAGPFTKDLATFSKYQYPDWFRNGKFGIWAHWGPQAVPEHGDWYARKMYQEGSPDYKDHLAKYGPPSKFGYKDIIPLWKAENWDPNALMALYKKAGAHYFVAQAVHHDNFDNWDSKFHDWNSVKMGPKKDMVGLWQAAALKEGLHFGVSEHLAASFTWFQDSHQADKTGPLAGVPYDGANPLYWTLYHWPAAPDDKGWMSTDPRWQREWFNRVSDLVTHYHPDLLYSDSHLPFGNDVGSGLVANFYNDNMAANQGKLQAVYNCKEEGGGKWVRDYERGVSDKIDPNPWQTDTSNGDWFYRLNDHYKSSAQVVGMLADIVSKNGNLLLNVVLKADGTLPPESKKLLDDLAAWMPVNGEAIFDTRPWFVYGEDPTAPVEAKSDPKLKHGNAFNEGKLTYSSANIRFTTKGAALYAIILGWPVDGKLTIKSLAKNSPYAIGEIKSLKMFGSTEKIAFERSDAGLIVTFPKTKPCDFAYVLKITGLSTGNK